MGGACRQDMQQCAPLEECTAWRHAQLQAGGTQRRPAAALGPTPTQYLNPRAQYEVVDLR